MATRRLTFVWAALCAASIGCAPPPFSILLAQHRDGEALCRAASVDEARQIVPRLVAQAKPSLYLRRVGREELPDLDPAIADDVFHRFSFAVVASQLTDRDGNPAGRVVSRDLKTTFELKGTKAAGKWPLYLGDPSDFVSLTGEPAPTYVTEKRIESEPWRPVDLLTLGLSRVTARNHEENVTTVSPDYDAARVAPKSAALYTAFTARFGQAPVVPIPRTEKPRHARVTSVLEIDFNDPDANECFGSLTLTLHSEPFDPDSDVWLDTKDYTPFLVDSWEGSASVHARWRTELSSHDADLEVPSPR